MPIALVGATRCSPHPDDLAEYDLKGRQIRDVVAMERRLAVSEGARLDRGRIKDAAKELTDFDKY